MRSAALLLIAAIALPQVANAHAVLVRSSPPKRAVLREAPKQIELWFNERLEPAYATITLTREGAAVNIGKTSVDRTDPKRVSVQLPELSPGSYTVRFRVLSVDGHVVEDSFGFSVGR